MYSRGNSFYLLVISESFSLPSLNSDGQQVISAGSTLNSFTLSHINYAHKSIGKPNLIALLGTYDHDH